MGEGDFRKILNGTGGVEDRMSVLWHHGVRTGRLTPSEFVRATSANCAQIFNVYPKKGTLQVGADADVVVWDPEGTRTISKDTHHQNIDFNIYEGMEVTGNPAMTFMRGKKVFDRGDVDAERGYGRYVDRPCFPPYWDAQRRRNALAEPSAVAR
jgi:dihydropyrimidinase